MFLLVTKPATDNVFLLLLLLFFLQYPPEASVSVLPIEATPIAVSAVVRTLPGLFSACFQQVLNALHGQRVVVLSGTAVF